MTATRHNLPNERLHFQHGPMDIVIGATGQSEAVARAHAAAWVRFEPLLEELLAERQMLWQPIGCGTCNPCFGKTARLMWDACAPFAANFITPMAAVAGAVAQTLAKRYESPGIEKAWINNGGDVAIVLSEGASVGVGVVSDLLAATKQIAVQGNPSVKWDASLSIRYGENSRGVATSGWGGRSFSLGIADSVTVLARTAAMADAAATVIANAVNVHDERIVRIPANQLKDNSDLGEMLVTVDVPALPQQLVGAAIEAGRLCAEQLLAQGLIDSAFICVQGMSVFVSACSSTSVLVANGYDVTQRAILPSETTVAAMKPRKLAMECTA